MKLERGRCEASDSRLIDYNPARNSKLPHEAWILDQADPAMKHQSALTVADLTPSLAQQRGACALIAIKKRAHCKARLADVLAPLARVQLVRAMLAAVLAAARASSTVRQIVVVSPERDCLPAEVPVLADTGECLNSALTQARTLLGEVGYRQFVILPADLPNITADEIDHLVRAGRIGGFAIAPDAAQTGTNALYLEASPPFGLRFGPDSMRLHLQEAGRLGLDPMVVRLAGLEFDLDSPCDLQRFRKQRWPARLQA